MPLPTIPQAVVIALPLFIAVLTGLLGHEQLPWWVNALITGCFVLGGAVLSIALGQGFTNNVAMDVVLFAGYSAALISSPILKPLLDKLLASTPSPLTLLFPPTTTVPASQGKTSTAATVATVTPWKVGPQPITLPPQIGPPVDMGG